MLRDIPSTRPLIVVGENFHEYAALPCLMAASVTILTGHTQPQKMRPPTSR